MNETLVRLVVTTDGQVAIQEVSEDDEVINEIYFGSINEELIQMFEQTAESLRHLLTSAKPTLH